MEIKIDKKIEWKFPCRAISTRGVVVDFSNYNIGTIVKGNVLSFGKGDVLSGFIMDYFKPLNEEKEVIDWEKVEYPIYAKNENGEVIIITAIDYNDYFNADIVKIITMPQLIHDEDKVFFSDDELNDWLNSLEILPKGTKIEITI